MLDRLWTSILDIVAQFVTPDWGRLIGMIPVVIALVVVFVVIFLFRALLRAPKVKRGARRIPTKTPAGIHMPGPSFAPVFAAVGVTLTMLGLVFNGMILVLGVVALILTLLYWLAEGIRIYDHDAGPTSTILPVVVQEPPPGVHMPGPSFRPIMGAIGVTLVMVGLVFGIWLLLAGVIALIVTLAGWLVDARREYIRLVEADRTGHMTNGPDPKVPKGTLAGLAALTIGAIFLQAVVFSSSAANGGTAGASPGASAAAGGGGSGNQTPPPRTQEPAADVTVVAQGVAFTTTSWTGPAGKAFTLAFDNEDQGTPHDVALKDSSGAVVFKGDVFSGIKTLVYDVPSLKAGSYTFFCTVHPSMTGTATLQ